MSLVWRWLDGPCLTDKDIIVNESYRIYVRQGPSSHLQTKDIIVNESYRISVRRGPSSHLQTKDIFVKMAPVLQIYDRAHWQ
jgi:hypothetical protein